jgi:BirA family biotin operon repressor/biotin-[acetyl-CoA-carboxylase] ligase
MTLTQSKNKIESLPGVKKIIWLAKTESTQDVARELTFASVAPSAPENNMENSIIIADEQTKGKGRIGRKWESSYGGIYMTIILKPKIYCKYLKDLSLLASEVVMGTLTEQYGIKARIKPPNDVYAFNPHKKKFLKICGVLTEAASVNKSPNWILLGIGINIENTLPKNLNTATSLREILRKPVNKHLLLKKFFEKFWATYYEWEFASESKSG